VIAGFDTATAAADETVLAPLDRGLAEGSPERAGAVLDEA
jgi:hypothetical protein